MDLKEIAYPRQVILVTSQATTDIMGKKVDKKNIFTLSWHMPVSFDPLLYAISAGKQRFSYGLIKKSGVFCVNFMPYELKDKVMFCGSTSGRMKDKFAESGLTETDCEKIHCPRIKEALAYLECEVTEEIEAGDHVIFIGKVLNANKVKDGRRIFQSKQGFITTEGQ